MNQQILIRRAKVEDFNEIFKLITQIHNLHLAKRNDIYKNVSPLTNEEFIEQLSDSNNVYFVAEFNEEVIGICFAQIKSIKDNRIMNDRTFVNISSLCVDERYQRQGIGSELYNAVVSFSKAHGIKNIELMVWSFNKSAIKFYESLGMSIKNLRYEAKL